MIHGAHAEWKLIWKGERVSFFQHDKIYGRDCCAVRRPPHKSFHRGGIAPKITRRQSACRRLYCTRLNPMSLYREGNGSVSNTIPSYYCRVFEHTHAPRTGRKRRTVPCYSRRSTACTGFGNFIVRDLGKTFEKQYTVNSFVIWRVGNVASGRVI
jgi:hypothetical protein